MGVVFYVELIPEEDFHENASIEGIDITLVLADRFLHRRLHG